MHIRHVINTHHNHIYTIIENVIQKRNYFGYPCVVVSRAVEQSINL